MNSCQGPGSLHIYQKAHFGIQHSYLRPSVFSYRALVVKVLCPTSAVPRICSSEKENHREDPEDLSVEFARLAQPERFRKQANHLELAWQASKRRKPKPCEGCAGTGESECQWCKGTGVLTVGEHIFCTMEEGCKPCPVCNRKGQPGGGQLRCECCKGTGWRASWMQ
ncbi:hypothetical protein WJX73_002052 [Symbiochloris irregularis]|uniref:Uncharacterized protein n=1 Tax=Symbiochloris irregularis TaxID=706552 RepID=A0AAW1NPS9_9CHLO